jgi:hypothetical protein
MPIINSVLAGGGIKIKQVQHGSIDQYGKYKYSNLSTAVDLSRSVLVFDGRGKYTGTSVGNILIKGWFYNNSRVSFEMQRSEWMVVNWSVIEAEEGIKVQHITGSWVTSDIEELTKDVLIPEEINVDRSILLFSLYTKSSSDIPGLIPKAKIEDSQHITLSRTASSSYRKTDAHYSIQVVEFL